VMSKPSGAWGGERSDVGSNVRGGFIGANSGEEVSKE